MAAAPRFTIKGDFQGICTDVYDGDTITVEIPFRQEELESFRIRMLRINAPEIKVRMTEPDRAAIKLAGLAAKDFLKEKIFEKEVQLQCSGFDNFGRVLATVFCDNEDICQLMLDSGHAVPFKK